jgi:serpin B
MRMRAWLGVALGLAVASAACSQAADDTGDEDDGELRGGAAASKAAVVKGNTAFAADMYRELGDGNDNLFFSPYSISTALAMTAAGAKGATATAMREGLRLPSGSPNAAFKAIASDLDSRTADQSQGGVPFKLTVANSLWGEKTQPFAPEFLSTVSENYGASLELADFLHKADTERKRINDWVENKTNDKIKNLLAQGTVDASTRLVLVNAIYFKASWDKPFKAENTEDKPFKPLEGGSVNVPMMGRIENMMYASTDAYDAIALPYVGGELEFVAIAPRAGTFKSFERSFTGEKLEKIYGELDTKRVDLSLPKFKIEGDGVKLKSPLTKMGMGKAFTDDADFSGITGHRDTKIDDVVHKAFVALDEKGTEAAAATAVVMRTLSMRPTQPAVARFDHPFIFAIRDVPTGSVLFLGRVTKP